jgi:hypothetical protein
MNSQSKPSDQFKALLTDPALQERFLPPMTIEEIAAVERLLDPVVEEAERWCELYSEIANRTMVVPISLLAIVQFPDLPADRLATIVKLISWVYAFDDFVDVPERSTSELAPVAEECQLLAAFDDGISGTTVWRCYLRSNEIESWPNYLRLHSVWATCLSRLVEAIVIQGNPCDFMFTLLLFACSMTISSLHATA